MLSRNDKMKKIAHLWTIEIGAGQKQCPAAGECASMCYAKDGNYLRRTVSAAHDRNMAATQQDNFVDLMVDEIGVRKARYIRVHSSGDFYSRRYLAKWFSIMGRCPDVWFYSYTKMVPMFYELILPQNFTVIYSYGGKYDFLINPARHRHSKVFSSRKDLAAAGYVDASMTDAPAMNPDVMKVGLLYHGRYNRRKNKPTLGVANG